MTALRFATLLLVAACSLPSLAQRAPEVFGLPAGQHSVGFQLLEDTYLWYPAETERAEPVRFGRYAELADDGPLARSLSKTRYAALLARPMRAVENGTPLAGPFPLVVIGLGFHYESPVTFAAMAEYLAGRGFVVATAPLDVEDLETQVRDLELVTARARQFAFVDPERLGVMGFDQGGMAGLLLAMRNRDVDAFVSLDSSFQYPYDPLALRVPWLHATGRADGAPSLFDKAVHSERYWLRIANLGHADFTSYALVEGRGEVAGYWSAATPAGSATHRAVAEYVLHFFGAYLAESEVSMALLDQAREALAPNAGMTLKQRPPTR